MERPIAGRDEEICGWVRKLIAISQLIVAYQLKMIYCRGYVKCPVYIDIIHFGHIIIRDKGRSRGNRGEYWYRICHLNL